MVLSVRAGLPEEAVRVVTLVLFSTICCWGNILDLIFCLSWVVKSIRWRKVFGGANLLLYTLGSRVNPNKER